MMRIWDSDLLSAQKDMQYVTDGLVLWLDGINNTRHGHDAASTAWEDLSGNGFDAAISGNITLSNNAYVFSGNTAQNMVVLGFGAQKGTYEVVFKLTGALTGSVFVHHGNTAYVIGSCLISTGTQIIMSARANLQLSYGSTQEWTNKKSTYSYVKTNNTGFVNGSPVALTASGSLGVYPADGRLTIGARHDEYGYSRPLIGEISCIRVYDRILTQEEIAQNYAVDKIRFGSGVNS